MRPAERDVKKPRPVTKEELAAVKQSVLDARIRIRLWRKGFRRFPKSESNFTEIVHDERTLLLEYQFDLGRESYRLNSATVKEVVQHALDTCNTEFFVKFGQLLARPALTFGKTGKETRLETFLLDHWAEPKDNLPELFYLTPDALTIACRKWLKQEGLSSDVVVKTRQRLGLKPLRRLKRGAVFRGGRWTFPPVDKDDPS